MSNLGQYSGKKLVTIESAEAADTLKSKEEKEAATKDKLKTEDVQNLITWMKDVLGSKVSSVKVIELIIVIIIIMRKEKSMISYLIKPSSLLFSL